MTPRLVLSEEAPNLPLRRTAGAAVEGWHRSPAKGIDHEASPYMSELWRRKPLSQRGGQRWGRLCPELPPRRGEALEPGPGEALRGGLYRLWSDALLYRC